MLAPHVQVLALGFREMVPCLLFGRSVEYRHNLLNCGGVQGRSHSEPSLYHPERANEKEQRSKKVESGREPVMLYSPLQHCAGFRFLVMSSGEPHKKHEGPQSRHEMTAVLKHQTVLNTA